jgi:NTE family protein
MATTKSGLVLGGGGSRGLAHVGVLQVLEREGYPIDLITGTSMGGMIAGFYGLLGSSDALIDLIAQPADTNATRLSRAPRPEIYESRYFRRWLRTIFGDKTFADLHWPVAMTAVDIDTGEEIVIKQGPVLAGIFATTALPGMYTPIEINGRWLVDGGVLDPVPVGLAQQMGATVTLAVDVLSDVDRPVARLPSNYRQAMLRKVGVSMDILSKAFDVMLGAVRDYRLREEAPDLLITPELHGLSTTEYHRADEFIARGVSAAEAVLPQIRHLRDRLLEERARGNGHAAGVPLPTQEQRA